MIELPGVLIWEGGFELKRVRNSLSILQCHSGVPPNDLEGVSLIPFCTPAICSFVNGDAHHALRRIANAMIRGPATFDDRVAIRFTHDTAAELLQYRPMCL